MTDRAYLMAGVACFALALLAGLAADPGATLTDDVRRGCADWWCAPSNRLPVGLAILFGGLGIVSVGIGLNRGGPEPDDEARTARAPDHPEGRSRSGAPTPRRSPDGRREPLWSRDRRPSP